jgi:hypothetical protein
MAFAPGTITLERSPWALRGVARAAEGAAVIVLTVSKNGNYQQN